MHIVRLWVQNKQVHCEEGVNKAERGADFLYLLRFFSSCKQSSLLDASEPSLYRIGEHRQETW